MDTSDDFATVELPHNGKRVLRLGLAANYGLDEAGVAYAAERGVNYWLWTPRFKSATPVLKRLLAREREQHVVSVLGNAVFAGGPRKDVEKACRTLGIDHVDDYKLGWLGKTSRFSEGIQETLRALVDEGKATTVGCSIHDRPRAAELARDSQLTSFMLRYNAKHPGAEQDVFPHIGARDPVITAYTATSWRQLLKSYLDIEMEPWPGEGEAPPLSAAQCYRFCLSNPHVHVCLTGPADRGQLDENLAALEMGPLSTEEEAWIRRYGAAVKAKTPIMSRAFE